MTLALWVGKRRLISHNYSPGDWYRGLIIILPQLNLIIGKGRPRKWTGSC